MASLRFHKVSSLPASGYTVGDVYYVVGQGIYVATSTTSCTKFAYANDAAADTKGVLSLNTVKGTKVNNAAAADSATTATNYTGGTVSIASKFTTVDSSISTINGQIGKINASVSDKTLTITKPDGSTVNFTDTDTHYSHGHTFKANAATSTSGVATSVDVVSALNAASATQGNLSSTYDMVKVPTLKVTDGLASRINSLEGTVTTGMQYKGTRTDGTVPAAGKVGDVYKVTTKAITGVGAEVGDFIVCNTATTSATNSAWDVWQANVNKDAYWDQNDPADGQIVVADGTSGKIKTTGWTTGSFDVAGTASGLINTLRGGSEGTLKGAYDAAANALSVANSKWGKVVASTTAQGIMQVGTGLSVSSGTVSVKYGTSADTACQGNDSRLSDARTPVAHNQASNTITKMTGYAISTSSAPAAISTDDSLNIAIGKLEKKVNDAQSTATNKWTKATATQASGGTAVEGTVIGHFADTAGFSVSPIINGVVYYKDTNTHYTNTFTITNGTTAAQTFAQDANKSLAIKAAAAGNLTASTSASTGTLTVNVGVASGYAIPSNDQITAWGKKWDAVNATTSSKGIASFNSNNFDVTNGAVSLAWAEFV